MDNKELESLTFDEPDLTSLNTVSNILKLADPPLYDSISPINISTHPYIETEKKEEIDDTMEELLNLGEPPVVDNDTTEETVAISKFAEQFVEPIVKEAIAMHKSEIEDEATDSHCGSAADKKSEKSSSDDGFEYVKDEEVEKVEVQHEKQADDRDNDDGDNMKRMLEDLVLQEEIRSEKENNVFEPTTKDDDEIYDALINDYQNESDSNVKILDLEEIKSEVTVVTNAGVFKEEVEDVAELEDEAVSHYEKEFSDEKLHKNEFVSEIPTEAEPHTQLVMGESPESSEHNICAKCKDIVSWAHPVSSALTFAILMFIELGLLMEYSIISLFAYSGLLLMLACLVYKIAANFRLFNTQSNVNCVITFNKEDVEYCVSVTLRWVDYLHKEIKAIAYVESFSKNIKVFVMLWLLTYVGNMFNLQSLIFIVKSVLHIIPSDLRTCMEEDLIEENSSEQIL